MAGPPLPPPGYHSQRRRHRWAHSALAGLAVTDQAAHFDQKSAQDMPKLVVDLLADWVVAAAAQAHGVLQGCSELGSGWGRGWAGE